MGVPCGRKELLHDRKVFLVIVWATKKFEDYLWGRKFKISTDEDLLVQLEIFKANSDKLMRWLLWQQ